jgi:hypothetical protein
MSISAKQKITRAEKYWQKVKEDISIIDGIHEKEIKELQSLLKEKDWQDISFSDKDISPIMVDYAMSDNKSNKFLVLFVKDFVKELLKRNVPKENIIFVADTITEQTYVSAIYDLPFENTLLGTVNGGIEELFSKIEAKSFRFPL